jgi:hypothetical protein
VNIERTTKLILIFPAQIVLSNFGLKLKTNPFLTVIIFECKRIIFKRICPLCQDLVVGVVTESVKGNRFDKRDDFNFVIAKFPFICCNIPTERAYGVYISQLVGYS